MVDQSPGAAGRMLDSIEKLDLDLKLIRLQFEAESAQRQDAENRPCMDRRAAYYALVALLEFIDGDPEWKAPQLGFGVRRLVIALDKIERGGADEMLIARPTTRPPLPMELQDLRGRSAAVVSFLMKQRPKWSEAEACSHVFRRLGDEAVR